MQIPNDFPTVPSGFDEFQVTNSRGGPSHSQATWWLLVVTGARPQSCCIRRKNPRWKRCDGQPVLVVERSMESWWKDQKDTFDSRIFMVTCPRWHLERSGFDAFCSIFWGLTFLAFLWRVSTGTFKSHRCRRWLWPSQHCQHCLVLCDPCDWATWKLMTRGLGPSWILQIGLGVGAICLCSETLGLK